MAQDNPPTALCFHQDSQAIPLFFRLQRSGLSVPGDISVTGFDDSTFAKEAELTTVRQRPYDMAVDAAQRLWRSSKDNPSRNHSRHSPCSCKYETQPQNHAPLPCCRTRHARDRRDHSSYSRSAVQHNHSSDAARRVMVWSLVMTSLSASVSVADPLAYRICFSATC